jgi:hypothetical protein
MQRVGKLQMFAPDNFLGGRHGIQKMTKEGISDNANWNDNDDEFENVVLCDMDGGLQPHVPQQSQPLPEPLLEGS